MKYVMRAFRYIKQQYRIPIGQNNQKLFSVQ